ncbi:MAG: hypothetical protein G01um101438_254 [Parcubacteria group bacterium Gr01-1014_38]|nr:MAG: hypothetical protein G01um101438_254 [Parcubacteria group bacterium Gr01-1014_38]
MSILEKYLKTNFPHDRLPTIEECVAAIEYPEAAEEWVKEYLRLRPEYEQYLRSLLELTQG